MSMETAAVKGTKDVTRQGIRIADGMLKKVWSIMDGAVEKKAPSEVLSRNAVSSIQGKIQG